MKRFALIGLLLLLSVPAQAALSIGNVTTSSGSGSFAHNNNGNALVFVSQVRGASTTTAYTFAGVSATQLCEITNGISAIVRVFYLSAPAAGSNTVVSTNSASHTTHAVVSIIDADASTPFTNMTGCTTATGTSTSASVSPTSASGQLVIATSTVRDKAVTVTVDGAETQLWNIEGPGGTLTDDRHEAVGSSKAAGASSTTMTHTISSSKAWAMVGIVAVPMSAPGTVKILGGISFQ